MSGIINVSPLSDLCSGPPGIHAKLQFYETTTSDVIRNDFGSDPKSVSIRIGTMVLADILVTFPDEYSVSDEKKSDLVKEAVKTLLKENSEQSMINRINTINNAISEDLNNRLRQRRSRICCRSCVIL